MQFICLNQSHESFIREVGFEPVTLRMEGAELTTEP